MERIREKMIEARTQREQMLHAHTASTEGMKQRKRLDFRSGMKRLLTLEQNNLWFLSMVAVAIAVVMVAWWVVSEQGTGRTRLNGPDPLESTQNDAVGDQTIEELETQITDLSERVGMLTDSITYLESKLIRAHVLTDSIVTAKQKPASSSARNQTAMAEPEQVIEKLPPSAAGQKAGDADLAQLPRQVSTGITNEKTPPRRPATAGTGGPWVINLVSTPSQADADRFAAMARSRDIQTEQQQVTIKGQPYWRVQITGFATGDEARAYAGTAREKLGLKDVWITRR